MATLLSIILLPFSLLYGLAVILRNLFFDLGILPSVKFNVPVISVGNLTMGGTGKTPHVEYLIRLLENKYRIATLSHGYGRKTSGFIIADPSSHSALDIGDEALQYARKFKKITVAVCENRRNGIGLLLKSPDPPNVILMDDAFQHRFVKPGLSVLLTDYFNLYTHDYLFPSGRLREPRRSARRADIIIVTKTDKIFSPLTERNLLEEVNPLPHQKVYLSFIQYEQLVSPGGDKLDLNKQNFSSIFLFAGIANSYPLEAYLKDYTTDFRSLIFMDHHQYTQQDLVNIRNKFESIMGSRKILVTTEKDYMRLNMTEIRQHFIDLPFYYIPIHIDFHRSSKQGFNKYILDYVGSTP
jgi:tetraacyldisaccharide 4'-kinase